MCVIIHHRITDSGDGVEFGLISDGYGGNLSPYCRVIHSNHDEFTDLHPLEIISEISPDLPLEAMRLLYLKHGEFILPVFGGYYILKEKIEYVKCTEVST